jgi:hypothetical protein
MVLNVTSGQAAVPTQNNTGSTLCTSDAVEQVTISAAPGSGTNRIDLVTVHPRGNDLDGGQNNDFIMDVIVGTAAATPVAPAVPAGQLALAQVYVTGGSASIITGNITDMRPGNLAIPNPTAFNRYAMRWDRGTAFTLPATASTWVILPMNAKVLDQANAYNSTTGLYTCPATGLYHVDLTISYNAAVSGGYVLGGAVYKNGTMTRQNINTQSQNPGYNNCIIAFVDQANAGDTYAAWVFSNIASLTGIRGANETSMSIHYLGPP